MSDHEAVGAETTEGEGISRRGFIAGAAGLTGVALSGVWRGSPANADTDAQGRVVTPTGTAFLELDGKIVGSLKQADGGGRFGEVVSEPPDENGYVDKHIGAVKEDDVVLKAGLGMTKPFYDWISSFCAGTDPGHEGAVILADLNFNAKSRMEFQGFIHEVAFPASDAASKEPAYMTVKIFAESSASKKASGQVNAPVSNQRSWLPANFRVEIAGSTARTSPGWMRSRSGRTCSRAPRAGSRCRSRRSTTCGSTCPRHSPTRGPGTSPASSTGAPTRRADGSTGSIRH